MKKTGNILLCVGIGICLLQIWLPAYYLTGDGPCHLYNAKILHDFWTGQDTAFYSRFFTLNYVPNPNWFASAILAALLFIFKGVIAEKFFLSLYIAVFVTGFHKLLKKISDINTVWTLVIFIFVFPQVLAKGFYNYSFSIGFFFWMVYAWIRFMEDPGTRRAVFFLFCCLLLFFTHLLPFVFASVACGALTITYAFSIAENPARVFRKNILKLIVLLLPFLVLMGWFVHREGGMGLALRPHFYRLIELVQFKYMVNITQQEAIFAETGGIILIGLFCVSIVKRATNLTIHKYDGFLVSLLFAAFVYLFFPENFMGRTIGITNRVQPLLAILAACCIACLPIAPRVLNVGGIALFVCFTGLGFARIPAQVKAGIAESDLMSVASGIRPNAVVLPLDFCVNGRDERGQLIADRLGLFGHAFDCAGAGKPLIILDNFEANMGYFPMTWKEATNPYLHLSKFEGIEGTPPFGVIDDYAKNSGVKIDYIVMYWFNDSFLQNDHFKVLYEKIQSGYHLKLKSRSGYVLLFEHNEGGK